MKKIKIFSLVLAVTMLFALFVPALQVSAAGTSYVYYVSENGDDTNDGKSKDKAFKNLYKAITKVEKANDYTKGDTVTIKLSGKVYYTEAPSDKAVWLGVYSNYDTSKNAFFVDETYKVPLTIEGESTATKLVFKTTYNDTDKLKYVQHYNNNDITFKNLTMETEHDAAATKKVGGLLLGAGSGSMVFDNVKFSNAGFDLTAGEVSPGHPRGWVLACDAISDTSIERIFKPTVDFFLSKNKPVALNYATLVFKNGDYTNVTAAALASPVSYAATANYDKLQATIKVQSGAKMGTVYGSLGDVGVGTTEVIVENGASIQKYIASGAGKAVMHGKVDKLTMSGGYIAEVIGASAGTKTSREIQLNVTGGAIGTYTKLGTGASAAKVTENIASGVIGGAVDNTPSTPSTPSTYTPNVITVDDNLKYAIANRELSSEDNTLKNYIKGTDITGLFIWPRIQRDIDLCYIVFSINADNNHYYTEEYPYDNGIEKIFELHDLTINIINESLNINLSFTADKISMNSYCEYSIETGATLEDQEKIQKLRNEYDINNRPICNISGTLYARYAPPTDQNEYRLIKMEYSTILGDRSQY